MDVKWLGPEVDCYHSVLRNKNCKMFRSFSLKNETFNVDDFAMIYRTHSKSLQIGKLLCVYESGEPWHADDKYRAIVCWYTWAKKFTPKLKRHKISIDEKNEVIEDSKTFDKCISLLQIDRKCQVIVVSTKDPVYAIKHYNLDSTYYFSCRYKIDGDLLPILDDNDVMFKSFEKPINSPKLRILAVDIVRPGIQNYSRSSSDNIIEANNTNNKDCDETSNVSKTKHYRERDTVTSMERLESAILNIGNKLCKIESQLIRKRSESPKVNDKVDNKVNSMVQTDNEISPVNSLILTETNPLATSTPTKDPVEVLPARTSFTAPSPNLHKKPINFTLRISKNKLHLLNQSPGGVQISSNSTKVAPEKQNNNENDCSATKASPIRRNININVLTKRDKEEDNNNFSLSPEIKSGLKRKNMCSDRPFKTINLDLTGNNLKISEKTPAKEKHVRFVLENTQDTPVQENTKSDNT